jgi:Flp pilus assembly protein CpaB
MNAKAVVPLIAGLGIAGLAGKLGFDYLKRAQGAAPKTVKLWAVNQDVPRGSAIDEINLRELNFPFDLAPKDAVVDKQDLIGRVPHTGVPANVPVLSSMLLAKGTTAGIHVPAGFRAIAVKIDEASGVDNHLQPSCHVDVVGYFQIKNNVTNKQETIARTIVENVEVAAVGPRLAPDAPEKGGDPKEKKTKTEQAKPARAVTLLVKPEQVPIIHLAEQKGEIKLSMRGDDDSTSGSLGSTKTVKDYDVTGVGAPKQEEDKGSMSDLLTSLMGKKEEPKPEPAVEPEPQEPPVPQYENVVVVYNGNEKRVLGWLPGNPEPIEISATEGANIFDDMSKSKSTHSTKHKPGTKAPGGKDAKKQQPEPEPQPQPEPEPQPETEQMPKELIG